MSINPTKTKKSGRTFLIPRMMDKNEDQGELDPCRSPISLLDSYYRDELQACILTCINILVITINDQG